MLEKSRFVPAIFKAYHGIASPQRAGAGAASADGGLAFRALRRLSTTDVANALRIARARILRFTGAAWPTRRPGCGG